jgi:hypothetical protein
MASRHLAFFAVLIAALLSGCASELKTMPLGDSAEVISTDSAPIYLMTASLTNQYKPSYKPEMFRVKLEREGKNGSFEPVTFNVDSKAGATKEALAPGHTYFLRMSLPPGDYVLRGFTGGGGTFLKGVGWFFVPLHVNVRSSAPGVYYLGHVTANVRERQEGEFRAGPLSVVTAFFESTFDVEISDRLDADLSKFQQRFPALRSVVVKKAIVGPFDRTKAQQYFDSGRGPSSYP